MLFLMLRWIRGNPFKCWEQRQKKSSSWVWSKGEGWYLCRPGNMELVRNPISVTLPVSVEYYYLKWYVLRAKCLRVLIILLLKILSHILFDMFIFLTFILPHRTSSAEPCSFTCLDCQASYLKDYAGLKRSCIKSVLTDKSHGDIPFKNHYGIHSSVHFPSQTQHSLMHCHGSGHVFHLIH